MLGLRVLEDLVLDDLDALEHAFLGSVHLLADLVYSDVLVVEALPLVKDGCLLGVLELGHVLVHLGLDPVDLVDGAPEQRAQVLVLVALPVLEGHVLLVEPLELRLLRDEQSLRLLDARVQRLGLVVVLSLDGLLLAPEAVVEPELQQILVLEEALQFLPDVLLLDREVDHLELDPVNSVLDYLPRLGDLFEVVLLGLRLDHLGRRLSQVLHEEEATWRLALRNLARCLLRQEEQGRAVVRRSRMVPTFYFLERVLAHVVDRRHRDVIDIFLHWLNDGRRRWGLRLGDSACRLARVEELEQRAA